MTQHRLIAGAGALALALAATFAGPAAGADAAAGRAKAGACATCHGNDGLSVQPNAPHLAGQPAVYVAEQLRLYRSGKRAHEVMSVVAKPLSDADIDDLAAWFASIRIEAKPPP
jgi:cytochrome c553